MTTPEERKAERERSKKLQEENRKRRETLEGTINQVRRDRDKRNS